MSLITITFYLFIFCLAIQLLYWLFIFSRVAFANIPISTFSNEPVSVVICGHNEGSNYPKFLPKILEQDYPRFEVIVANDRSSDNSKYILDNLQKTYPHLRVIHLNDFDRQQIGKKHALTIGIKAAKNELILLTDADSYPRSNQWIKIMSAALVGKKSIGIAYAPFDKRPTFLNRFLRFDKLYIAIQYLSFGLVGCPYMGTGPNMIYCKRLFLQAKGFEKHAHLISGDDDLFVNEVADNENTAIILHPDSLMYCEPKETLKAFYHQKSRHLSTSWHYQLNHQLLLGVLAQTHFWLYVFGFVAFFRPRFQLLIGLGILLRWIVMYLIFRKVAIRYDEDDLSIWLPLMDVLYVPYFILFAFPLLKGSVDRWE